MVLLGDLKSEQGGSPQDVRDMSCISSIRDGERVRAFGSYVLSICEREKVRASGLRVSMCFLGGSGVQIRERKSRHKKQETFQR